MKECHDTVLQEFIIMSPMFAFLWCKRIDLTRGHTGPTNLKIALCVCVCMYVSAGSCHTEVSPDQSWNRKSSVREVGRGRGLFPDSFSRAAFSGTAHFLVPHALYTQVHMCMSVCVRVHTHTVHNATTISCCAWGYPRSERDWEW